MRFSSVFVLGIQISSIVALPAHSVKRSQVDTVSYPVLSRSIGGASIEERNKEAKESVAAVGKAEAAKAEAGKEQAVAEPAKVEAGKAAEGEAAAGKEGEAAAGEAAAGEAAAGEAAVGEGEEEKLAGGEHHFPGMTFMSSALQTTLSQIHANL